MMEKIALTTLLVPFIGALLTACSPKPMAKNICSLFALFATLGTVVLGWQFLAGGKTAPLTRWSAITESRCSASPLTVSVR